tara:strand:+ start:167 stop:343 length:177 start_codon:yes stop_codon:yes gene_type:complete
MATPKDLTKGQKETLKKLLLKQKQWEKSKEQIKQAKAKPKATKAQKSDLKNKLLKQIG